LFASAAAAELPPEEPEAALLDELPDELLDEPLDELADELVDELVDELLLPAPLLLADCVLADAGSEVPLGGSDEPAPQALKFRHAAAAAATSSGRERDCAMRTCQ
jgi:hypothetical protein